MLASREEEDVHMQFSWGRKRGPCNSNGAQFYWSFTYNETEYFLYDCVFFFKKDDNVSHIGKLIKIWECADKQKKVKALWFLRPMEIVEHLGNYIPLENELFLASGEGRGVTNVNSLEAIGGKCNVVCLSKDKRNTQPTEEEHKKADYVFYRTFDVGCCKISNKIPEEIAGIKVELLLNRKKMSDSIQQVEACKSNLPVALPEDQCKSDVQDVRVLNNHHSLYMKQQKSEVALKSSKVKLPNAGLKRMKSSDPDASESAEISAHMAKIKRTGTSSGKGGGTLERLKCDVKQHGSSHGHLEKPRSSLKLKLNMNMESKLNKGKEPAVGNNVKKKWFAEPPWSVEMGKACRDGRLVMLDNLDITYSAVEVEEILWRAFKQKCTVRLIEQSAFTNPQHGQALALFKSSDAAKDAVLSLCKESNLLLINGRPLLASIGLARSPERTSSALIGLQSTEKLGNLKKCQEQANTIEYEMAMEWMLLDHKFSCYWEELYRENELEMARVCANLGNQ